ncbi:hypothetical protein AWW72_14900 [Acinetobacter sp. NRRL B-65365]|uniref:hypothetical protein n=1 Tax=Acinetobacter sp. NRRL B-65365 TaxID=1785092 RepID=UPI0007A08583|nr:hypothetical protein [Acinetobacter sp. NRRL B-65365]KYQ83283.1 hypothetical protein AWW72_14900 [Acinetobacter sp. NRRL B-65365]
MSLLNAIMASNQDARRVENPTSTFNGYVALKVEHDKLLEKVFKQIDDTLLEGIDRIFKENQAETIVSDSIKTKYKVGEGNVFFTFTNQPNNKNILQVKKTVLIERDEKGSLLEIVATPILKPIDRNDSLKLGLTDYTAKIQNTPADQATSTFIQEIEKASVILITNQQMLNSYEENNYEIWKNNTSIGGAANKGTELKLIIDRLTSLSGLFD